MVQYVFTPWRNRAELLAVRQQFYPRRFCEAFNPSASPPPTPLPLQSPETVAAWRTGMREAVARVEMWMGRGSCPHAVDSTSMLVAAMLADGALAADEDDSSSSSSSSSGAPEALAAKLVYAAALNRFVTGILDIHQDRARKQSMYQVARSIGLADEFVELRHQATHEPLPTLRRLRSIARKALAWLWGYYWVHLADVVVEPTAAAADGPDGETTGSGSSTDLACRAELQRYVEEAAAAAAAADPKSEPQPEKPAQSQTASHAAALPFVAKWGHDRVLRALADLAPTGPADLVAPASSAAARLCISMSRAVLASQDAELAATGSKVPEPPEEPAAEPPTKPPTESPDSLDLNEMRANLELDRQALYRRLEEDRMDDNDGSDDSKDNDDKDGGDDDVVMGEDAPTRETLSRLENPRWQRWDGEWTPRPIGVV